MERYDNLDGLRVFSCIGIVAMHIKANTTYQISGWIWKSFIPSLTLLVYLFLMISGFGMFCGYYEKVKKGSVDWNQFYAKRYKKVLPFFTLLILLDVVIQHSPAAIIEGFTEITLAFGLLPNNNLSVIGIGWTLGVIFLFYMLFPFFVWLCWTKKRVWLSLAVTCVLTIFCERYFFTSQFVVDDFLPRHDFLYSTSYFVGGGMVYLYRKEIKGIVSKHQWLCLLGCLGITVLYYLLVDPRIHNRAPNNVLLFVFLPWLCYAIGADSKILNNKVMKYLSGISLELYLAQMVIFRAVEKAGLLYKLGTGWISFVMIWVVVIIGLIVFIEAYKFCVRWISKRIKTTKSS